MPFGLLEAIASQRHRFTDLEFVCAFTLAAPAVLEHLGEPFRWTSLQPSGPLRAHADHPAFAIVPARYSDIAGLLRPGGALAADVLVCGVSEPDANGNMSLGTGVGGHVGLLGATPLVIGQVNSNMPYVMGDGECHATDFDLLVSCDEPLAELAPATIDATSEAIAAHVAPFIAPGSALQFGIGAIPDAVLSTLGDRHGLSLRGGMINDACVDLIEAGVFDAGAFDGNGGVCVAAEVMGTSALYEWCDRNPRVRLVRGCLSHGIEGLATVERFVALQSTVEVALDGSANSEVVGGSYISGPGGAPDFAFAASVATGGRAIMALPSTAAKGTASRIVPRVAQFAPTTLPNYLADVVATEFGAVELRGRSLAQRARLLSSIAHPDFRDQLEAHR